MRIPAFHLWIKEYYISCVHLKIKIQLGDKILFWEDCWVGSQPPAELFPRLYRLFSLHLPPILSFYFWDEMIDARSLSLFLRHAVLERDVNSLAHLLSKFFTVNNLPLVPMKEFVNLIQLKVAHLPLSTHN